MTQETLKNKLTTTKPGERPKTFAAVLEQYKPQIAAALPKHLNADRMARIALTAFRQNPKLAECDPTSVFASVIIASQLGLEPGVLGQGYLVPYNDNRNNRVVCQFIPGWQGLVDLAQRTGRVAGLWTGAVYEGDEFEYAYGSEPYVKHIEGDGDRTDPNKLTAVYACGRVKGSEMVLVEVWRIAKVVKHRDRYNRVGKRHYSYEHLEMYARKVALLQLLKYVPKSPELALGTSLEHAAQAGVQLDIKDAISGEFIVPEPSTTEPNAQDALNLLNNTSSLKELEAAYESVRAQYAEAKTDLPVEVEGAYNDHKLALEQTQA